MPPIGLRGNVLRWARADKTTRARASLCERCDFGTAEAIGIAAQVVGGGLFHAVDVAGSLQGDHAQVGGVFAARVPGVSAEKAREARGCREVVAAIER